MELIYRTDKQPVIALIIALIIAFLVVLFAVTGSMQEKIFILSLFVLIILVMFLLALGVFIIFPTRIKLEGNILDYSSILLGKTTIKLSEIRTFEIVPVYGELGDSYNFVIRTKGKKYKLNLSNFVFPVIMNDRSGTKNTLKLMEEIKNNPNFKGKIKC